MKTTAIICLYFLGVTGVFAQRGNPQTSFGGQTPDAMIADFMQEHQIAGMTLAIVQAPYIPRVVGYGVADKERALLASPNTLWMIGELTQAYTAVALMQLVEAGQLTLDARLGDTLPDLPQEWQALTVRQLMGHASGLPDYTRQPGFDFTKDYQPADVLASIKGQPLAFTPGTRVARSASNFFLLGLVIEKISGLSYEEFVTRGQIEPLGLKNTLFPSGLAKVKSEAVELNGNHHKQFLAERAYIDPTELARGYAEVDGKVVAIAPGSQSALFAHGTILASATDISIWDMGLAGGILVKQPENRALIYHGFKLADGTVWPANAGWRFPATKGLMDITGHAPGYSVYLSRFTDKADLLCVTLCANKGGVDLTELARRVAGAFKASLGPPADPANLTCVESCFPVNVTIDRLEAWLKSQGTGIIARVDHAVAAKRAGLDLRPTETLIFGNPAVGTHLMLSRQPVAADLPLRMVAWLDEKGRVWLGWHEPSLLAAQHGIADQAEVVAKMKAGLAAAAAHATSPY